MILSHDYSFQVNDNDQLLGLVVLNEVPSTYINYVYHTFERHAKTAASETNIQRSARRESAYVL